MGGASALLSVAAGAFGAHALKARLEPAMLQVFETGARYQMYHALALLAVGALWGRWQGGGLAVAGWSFVAGTVLFSGSLYALALSGQRWLGALTPLGGVAFLLGWAAVVWAAARG
jgi:uncharacterized membrane protein YgdD (TMEM256/DUF423 family)